MTTEHGIAIDHTTIHHWLRRYAPKAHKPLELHLRSSLHQDRCVDETYAKVKGQRLDPCRVVDERDDAIDSCLSPIGNAMAAKRFLGKSLKGRKHWEMLYGIHTDKAGCNRT